MSRMFEYRMSINPGRFHRTTYLSLKKCRHLAGYRTLGLLASDRKMSENLSWLETIFNEIHSRTDRKVRDTI